MLWIPLLTSVSPSIRMCYIDKVLCVFGPHFDHLQKEIMVHTSLLLPGLDYTENPIAPPGAWIAGFQGSFWSLPLPPPSWKR